MSARRLTAAIAVATALILSAPFIGRIRNAMRAALPGQYVAILGAVVGLCAAAAVIAAIVRIRERRPLRYGLVGAALIVAVGYSAWTARPDPQINAVERFHFIEYGIVTFMFYRAWRPLDDGGVAVLPVLAALIVALVEEWFQWFIPGRVGALEDVVLNWAAILSGLLFSLGVDPARSIRAFGPRSRRQAGIVATAAIVIFGWFFDSVHLGYRVHDANIGSFTSIYEGPDLAAHARDRAARWRVEPPIDRTRLAQEDQYRTEGTQHVRRRNEAWAAGDIDAAWRENLILEKYYAPVLDLGHRWPREQHEDAARRQGPASSQRGSESPYVSQAYPYPVYAWPRAWFWTVVLAVSAAVLAVALNLRGTAKRNTAMADTRTHV